MERCSPFCTLSLALVVGLAVLTVAAPALLAADVLPGPIPAQVVRVIDGDSLLVRATIWPGQTVLVNVRLSGIDTAETRAPCEAARTFAARAVALITVKVSSGSVALFDVRFGKYAGRVIARVETDAGTDLAALLLAEGVAKPYETGPRPEWCIAD